MIETYLDKAIRNMTDERSTDNVAINEAITNEAIAWALMEICIQLRRINAREDHKAENEKASGAEPLA